MFSRTVSQGKSVYDWNTMPRSAPGAATGVPSSTTRPVVGVSRPATMRSSVDLPQPEGPRIVMKSLSCDRERGRLQRHGGGAAAHAGKRPADAFDRELAHSDPGSARVPPEVMVRALGRRTGGAHARLHGNSRWFAHLNRKSEMSPITPITMMPKMICPVLSSAWLSVIMWPMPDDAPISSATIT